MNNIVICLCISIFFSCNKETNIVEQNKNEPEEIILPSIPNAESYKLVFQDEFEGTSLDWTIWDSDQSIQKSASGQMTYRSKQNIEVSDGLLKLLVKKESIEGSEWSAAFVWLRKTFGVNTYYETRFINTKATGVNNAFWMACKTNNGGQKAYHDRYEIDCPENKLHTDGKIHAHLAWHDWKSYSYNPGDIAQGISITIDNTDYHTWGLWVGETEMVIYYNREVQWRGTTHSEYTDQYCSGIGKFPEWSPEIEKSAYGKFEQDDWCYYGGFNGDRLNVCFSTIPWSSSGAPISTAAEDCFMGIDYLRIFKPKQVYNTVPEQEQTEIISGVEIELEKPIDLDQDEIRYFSFVARKTQDSNISISLNSDDELLSQASINSSNEITLFNGQTIASTKESYPANGPSIVYFDNSSTYWVVGRITAKKGQKDIISYKFYSMDMEIPEQEPFLYHNIDAFGNTNKTNEWHINHKLDASVPISDIVFDFNNNTSVSNFKIASNYLAVIPNK